VSVNNPMHLPRAMTMNKLIKYILPLDQSGSTLSIYSTMDPQNFVDIIEYYIENLEANEIQELFQLQNNQQDQDLYIQDGEDEVDLVDG